MERIMMDPKEGRVAELMGYASIGFWLFAQAPQVFKNARLKSCEGLSLPFLCNWLFGDITNLIGCVLTHQLPFQTYLAIYFCAVDLTLVCQYFYYQPRHVPSLHRIPVRAYASPHQSFIVHTAPARVSHSRTRSASAMPSSSTIPEGSEVTIRPQPRRSHHSTQSHPYVLHGGQPIASGSGANQLDAAGVAEEEGGYGEGEVDYDGRYQAIFEAAMDVARAAERVSAKRKQSQSRSRRHRQSTTSTGAILGRYSHNNDLNGSKDDDIGNIEGSAMFESFHSDLSARSAHSDHSTESAKKSYQNMSSSTPTLHLNRGRSLQRTATGVILNIPTPPVEEDVLTGLPEDTEREGRGVGKIEMREQSRSKSRSLSTVRNNGRGAGSGSGRKAAGVAFMSLGLLFRWNGISGVPQVGVRSPGQGSVLALQPRIGDDRFPPIHPPIFSSRGTIDPSSFQVITIALPDSHTSAPHHSGDVSSIKPHEQPPPPPPIDYQRMVGRISAWICTTLYLTSRLPQIWKNFQRKSVEGLSILLFLFAFCGNVFYVMSIAFNPAASEAGHEGNHYLLEALPYLLGSGGTLLFDLTIIFQSLLYGSQPPIPPTSLERSSFRRYPFRRKIKYHSNSFDQHSQIKNAQSVSEPHTRHPTAGSGERQPLLSQSMVLPGPARSP